MDGLLPGSAVRTRGSPAVISIFVCKPFTAGGGVQWARPGSLVSRPRRPRRPRQPSWSAGQERRVLDRRRRYPRWGKDKLAVLLRRQGPRAVGLDGRAHPQPAEAARPTSRTTACSHLSAQALPVTLLRHPQAQRLCAAASRRLGRDRYVCRS
jgi:hypothetical protein